MLIAVGDSFFRGDELSDCNPKTKTISQSTWPALMAKALGRTYLCDASGGRANGVIATRTVKTVTTALERHPPESLLVVVGWTINTRFSATFSTPLESLSPDLRGNVQAFLEDYPDLSLSAWSVATPEEKAKTIPEWEQQFRVQYRIYKELGVLDYANAVLPAYDWVQSEIQTFKDVALTQLFLNHARVPYVMSWSWIAPPRNITPAMKPYYDLIDPSRFIPGDDFVAFTKANHFPIGVTHPLEEAHAAYGDIALNYVNNFIIR